MEEEKFWQLLSVKLTNEATDEELQALDELLQQHPEFGLQAQLMLQLWKKNNDAPENKTADFFNRHLQRISNQPDMYPVFPESTSYNATPPVEKVGSNTSRWIVAAAGMAASLTIAWLFFTHAHPIKKAIEHDARNTVTTRRGSKSNIELPDGSMAWLNADSKLTYNDNFRGEIREVTLEGEAFFDVVKDKTRPFIIHTKTIDIRVLGTAFNVRAYETEKNTETSLFRGSVEVSLHNDPEKKIVLKPNEKLMVNNKDFRLDAHHNKDKKSSATDLNITVGRVHFQAKDSSAWETLWIKNKLVFDEESLEEVARKIERWYDVQVIINGDDDLRHTAFSGIFDNESLLQVMDALKITGNFTYTIRKNIVTIQ